MNALIFLDFSKAFDSVHFEIGLKKLEVYFSFSHSAILLIKNYLKSRSLAVFVNGNWSSLKVVSSGVPQGSILGPFLCLLFINDLPLSIDVKSHIYSDDVQLYRTSDILSIKNSINLLNKDIKKVIKWSISNGITINSSKSQAISVEKCMYI